MRLIDADALFAEFENVGWYNNADRDEIAEPLILRAPTIDAVSVVRCKDCMWWINNLTEFSADEDFLECRWNEEESPNADDFCSYGERKESE